MSTMIDLRSDTVTRPTPTMRDAMFSAPVGDDVFGEDPSVNALEEKVAKLFGLEAAIYCASGSMANQIAVKAQTQPGDEVICSNISHVYYYEGGGIAFNSGASVCLLEGDRGRISAAQVKANINPEDLHRPVSSLVCLENTMNKGGGAIYDFAEIEAIARVCHDNKLKLHLDGARLFNAMAETGETPKMFGSLFDTISVCLSKGLGAPVGSVLMGSKETIRKARRIRKVFGGGMRQAGFLAAAGIYALDHHVERLKDDHRRAKTIGKVLETLPYVESILPIETNIIYFNLTPTLSPETFLQKLKDKDIHAFSTGPHTVRFVTHLDFTEEMMGMVCETLKNLRL